VTIEGADKEDDLEPLLSMLDKINASGGENLQQAAAASNEKIRIAPSRTRRRRRPRLRPRGGPPGCIPPSLWSGKDYL
jgi:hypothetical protein